MNRTHTFAFSKNRAGQTLKTGRRKLAPMLEAMEDRKLMTAGAGFLSGTITLDGAGSPVSGATVELFTPTGVTPIAQTTTGADGSYLLTGLSAGDYLLKEVPPSGYSAKAAAALSQLNPASVVGADTIKVSIVDPANVFVNYGGIVSGSYMNVNDSVKGGAQVNAVGPMADTLGTSAGATDLNAGYQTFCVNDLQSLSFSGGESYQVVPKPISQLNDGTSTISADHSGRIAYLFNHYGNSSLSNIQGGGLQLAIWELLYDSGNTPDFNSGAFQATSPYAPNTQADFDAVIAQAQAYYADSSGHHESGVFLDAAAANPGQTQGLQSVLATGSFNFTVQTTPTNDCGCQDVTNVSYLIDGTHRVTNLRGQVTPGDYVEADFTVPAGKTETFSLVSYTAPQSYFDANTASQQVVAHYSTETFGPGPHSLSVQVPAGNFQVDFVCGTVIAQLGPAGSNNFYTPQGRLISADNGGPTVPVVNHNPGCDNHDKGGDNHHKGGDNQGHGDDNHDKGGDRHGKVCDNKDKGGDHGKRGDARDHGDDNHDKGDNAGRQDWWSLFASDDHDGKSRDGGSRDHGHDGSKSGGSCHS